MIVSFDSIKSKPFQTSATKKLIAQPHPILLGHLSYLLVAYFMHVLAAVVFLHGGDVQLITVDLGQIEVGLHFPIVDKGVVHDDVRAMIQHGLLHPINAVLVGFVIVQVMKGVHAVFVGEIIVDAQHTRTGQGTQDLGQGGFAATGKAAQEDQLAERGHGLKVNPDSPSHEATQV